MDHENGPGLTYARSWVESTVRTDAELMCYRLDFTQNLAARRIELEDMSVGAGRHPARIRANIDITGGTYGNAVQLTAELLLAQVPAVQIEPLQAAVFAVGYIESLIGYRNIVRDVEFASAGAALAPFAQLLAVCAVFDKAAVAVTEKAVSVAPQNGRFGSGMSPTLISMSFFPSGVNL